MTAFLNDDFLLNTSTAKALFANVKDLPIIDYHCHIQPGEIYENRRYDTITQVWLGGDHYKWRLMRAAGVEEKYITGDADDHEKFLKWAEVLGKAIGNPLYHWSHLELRRYFNYQGILNKNTAEEVWTKCNETLARADYGVRGLIGMSNVELICTTDDPIDTLEWHEKIAADASFTTRVLPAWRPDKAVNIEKAEFASYIEKLSAVSGIEINSFADLKEALKARMAFFHAHGCRLSDHGLDIPVYAPNGDIESIFAKKLGGGVLSETEIAQYKHALLAFFAGEYNRLNWVMQIHTGALRSNNPPMLRKLGPDTGYDGIDDRLAAAPLTSFLGDLEDSGKMPKTILYSLNPHANVILDAVAGCFQNSSAVCRVQHGSAWWFNDHIDGMTEQMKSLAATGYLAGFVGMLTDSRSFLSYPRHEYFRRILCRILGEWVRDGFFPDDMDTLVEIARNICYFNAKNYFPMCEGV